MVELLKLEMEGFGKFAAYTTIKFDKQVNFITGLNETGKSTMLEAMMASIFKYTKNQIHPFLCWKNDKICRVALTYKVSRSKSRVYKITCDYISSKRKLESLEKGKFREIAAVDKNIDPLLKEHFGFDDKKVFENTAFIRQSQMAILEDNSIRNKIKDMIEEVFAGRSEASATKSLAKVRKVVKDCIKEIDDMDAEGDELKERLESAEETKETIFKDSGEFETTNKKLSDKAKELEKLKRNKKLFDEKEKLLSDMDHIDKQMEKVEELVQTLSVEEAESQPLVSNKTIGYGLIIVGILISLTGIGALIGIPMVIYGVVQLRKKEKEKKPVHNGDEKLRKYQKEKKDLINRKAVLESRLDEYKLVKFTINDFDELDELEKEVESLKSKKVELHTAIKTTTSLVESPEEIKEKLDAIEERIHNLKRHIEEHEIAAKYLEIAESKVHQKFTPAIVTNSKPILKEITNGRYADLKISEDTLDVKVKAPEIKEFVDIYYLSQGARDQLYFTLRSVMSDLLSGNRGIPLILDDPFHNFDDTRLTKTIDIIRQLAKNKQIILISHRPYHKEFKNFDTVNVLEFS